MPDAILSHVPGMRNATPVLTIDATSLREDVFYRDFISNSQPCVIRGAIRHWPAMQKWRDKDYLKRLSGHHKVAYFPHENFLVTHRMEAGKRMMSFAEGLDLLHSEATQVASLGFPEELSEMLPDMGGFSFLGDRKPPILYHPIVRHFIYRNAGTTWHYHPVDETLMCQVIGSKKIGLLSAVTRYQKAIHSVFFQEDYYDDPAKMDRFARADLRWHSARLDEGDALYIPPLWWHGVVPATPSFGLTTVTAWRSPLHVIADTINKMDAGDIDLVGFTSFPEVRRLLDAAGEIGLELDVRRSAPLSISIRPSPG
jgi:hypothetical protein